MYTSVIVGLFSEYRESTTKPSWSAHQFVHLAGSTPKFWLVSDCKDWQRALVRLVDDRVGILEHANIGVDLVLGHLRQLL